MLAYPDYPNVLRFESLEKLENVSAFYTTRFGGCSEGAYSSFNLSYYSGDDPGSVTKNRLLLCKALHLEEQGLFVPNQIHGTEIARIDETFLSFSPSEQKVALLGKDALVTSCRRVAVAVTTADCVPIVLYETEKQVVAAIHAGWRGTCGGILQKTVRLMVDAYSCTAEKIHAAIGPSISVGSFEVGPEVRFAFEENGFDMQTFSFFNPLSGKWHIDLWGINRQEMLQSGIPSRQIETVGVCTLNNTDSYFSARVQGISSGRMLTGIFLV